MNKYELWYIPDHPKMKPGNITEKPFSNFKKACAAAAVGAETCPIEKLEIRKLPWWRTWLGDNTPVRYRYDRDKKKFVIYRPW